MLHLKRSQNVVKFYSNILNFTSYVCSELLLCLIFLSLIVVIIQKPQSVEELHYLDIRTCRYCHTWFISMLRQKITDSYQKILYSEKQITIVYKPIIHWIIIDIDCSLFFNSFFLEQVQHNVEKQEIYSHGKIFREINCKLTVLPK